MEILTTNRLHKSKRAFSTRRVNLDLCTKLKVSDHAPVAGDLVLARIVELGSHSRIELPTGRRAKLQLGDEILLGYGNRYAPDQYEAYVPTDLGPCHMVAAGGVAARAVSWHERLAGPTGIQPIGVVADSQGAAINLGQFRCEDVACAVPPVAIAVFGSSMNAGKTISAASLVKGFADTGLRVGALKITGTAAGGDTWLMRDYGASEVFDFTDAGFTTTFMEPVSEIMAGAENLMRLLGKSGCDVAVIEVADGLYQKETSQLAAHPALKAMIDGVYFAANDALGAVTGVSKLRSLGHNVLGVSGAVMRSPLASAEAASQLDTPMLHLDDLQNPDCARGLLDMLYQQRPVAAE